MQLIFNSQFGDQSRNGIIGLDDIEISYHKCSMKSEKTQALLHDTTPVALNGSITDFVRLENQVKPATKNQTSHSMKGVTFLPLPGLSQVS